MYDLSIDIFFSLTKIYKVMKKLVLFFFILVIFSHFLTYAFNIPKFYHAKIFQDETRFSRDWLSTVDLTIAGGSRHFHQPSHKGKLDFTELYFQYYQNFKKGLFFQLYLPFSWIKISDIELTAAHACPLDHCMRKGSIYSPALLAGWTLNYEDTTHLDFIDATFQLGALLQTPHDAVAFPLFPIGYTTKPGFAAAGSCALGALEWLTLGTYGQALLFAPATIWSSGAYIKLDHIIPTFSAMLCLCGDGQNKQIESIAPWRMFSLYISAEIDLAGDERPWLPRIKAFYSKPLAGNNILKAGLGGLNLGIDSHIVF